MWRDAAPQAGGVEVQRQQLVKVVRLPGIGNLIGAKLAGHTGAVGATVEACWG